MKIVLSSLNFAPELTGIGKYSGEMADGLVERGHEVVVVCAPPYYPQWQLSPGYRAWAWRVERPKRGLTVIRCPLWVPRQPSAIKRLVHLLSFMLSSLPVMLALALWRPTMVFAVAPAFFCAPAAWLTARLSGAKAWLHVQDFELDAAFELGLLKGGVMRRVVSLLERVLLQRFDHVSTISQRMMRQLARKGVAPEHSHLLPNWVNLRQIRRTAGSPALRRQLEVREDQVVFLFSGSMNRKQNLPVLFEAMRLLEPCDDIALVISGDGELRRWVEEAAAGRENIRVMDLQPLDRLNELLNLADVHLLPQVAGAADLVMPSKLSGMLASGRPVIAAASPGTELSRIVNGRGLLVAPESAVEFAAAMRLLADEADTRQRLGAHALVYAETALCLDCLLNRVESSLTRAVSPPTMGDSIRKVA